MFSPRAADVLPPRQDGSMPLTLVLGPANSAKAGEVLGAFAAARRRGALLVVPTARDAEAYSRELAADGAILGGSVLTFSGLAREIARRAGYEQTSVSELQRQRLLRTALERTKLATLAESASAPGFAAAALELIAELERSLISTGRFAQALGAWAEGDEWRSRYGREIASIYRNYTRQLERLGRVDAELYAWRALDELRAAPGRWGSTPVFFYGFDDLTPLERDAIETLAMISGAQVTVSLTYEPGRAALAARAEVVEELRALAERVIELPALETHYADSSNSPNAHSSLHFLERHLFEGAVGGASERIDPGDAVRLLEAGGERAEVELVAAEVLALLRAGVAAEEIAVVYRSLEASAALIERVFDAFGIPVSIEREIPFAHTPLGRGVLAMARCSLLAEDQAGAAELLAYLRTPGVLARLELADRLEATVLQEGLRTAAQARERSSLRFGELDALRDARDPAREIERQARRLLGLAHRGEAVLLDRDEQLDASALAVLARSLAELGELGERLSGRELVQALEELTVRSGGRGGAGRVLVAQPLQIRARRFRAVFVCGLQEGAFPAPGAPEPFLSDERRRELNVASGLRLRPREDSLPRERYLFYSCVSRATERLVLSWRSSDEEGNVELASPFIADVAELFSPDWFARRRRRLLADVVFAPSDAPTERERARAEAVASEPSSPVPATAPQSLSQTALGRIRHSEILSAGALESYADCPVKWLVERELQPELLGPEPDPLVRGSFIHDLLERLLERLGGAVTPQSLPEAERILAELLQSEESPLAPGRPASVRAAALRSVAADMRRYLVHEAASAGGWSPEALELKFGFEEEESLPALELSEGVRLRGMIDRLDVDGRGGAIVRDYKSGGTRSEYCGARWSDDRQLQVALYMIAVRELLGLAPVAGFYQPLGGDDLRARGVFLEGAPVGAGVVANDGRSRDELDEALEDARSRAAALAARLRSGELTPCPETCSRDGCSYPGICRTS
jgi:ATP-dependent helicase/DNAse subunit B